MPLKARGDTLNDRWYRPLDRHGNGFRITSAINCPDSRDARNSCNLIDKRQHVTSLSRSFIILKRRNRLLHFNASLGTLVTVVTRETVDVKPLVPQTRSPRVRTSCFRSSAQVDLYRLLETWLYHGNDSLFDIAYAGSCFFLCSCR